MEFLRYPQLIPAFFNSFYVHFTLAMDRSPGFGSTSCNCSPYSDSLSLRLRSSQILTSLHNVTRRSVLQKVHGRAFNALPLLVNTGFQVLFHSPPGVLFTFPSRYYALSVTKSYLALGGGPPCFPPSHAFDLSLTRLLLSLAELSSSLLLKSTVTYAVHNPSEQAPRFGLFPVRSPLLRKSMFLSLPSGT